MKCVKVNRYVAGKRPKYAPQSDDEIEDSPKIVRDESKDEVKENKKVMVPLKANVDDKRLKRLQALEKESSERSSRLRHISEPVILKEKKSDDDMDIEPIEDFEDVKEKSESEEDIDEEERIRRRMELRKKALQRQEELLTREEEKLVNADDSESEEESEYEEDETESEDEIAPRLKPVFIRKKDRVTVQEKESQLEKEKEIELEKEQIREENKKEIKKIIQEEVAREKFSERETDDNILCDFKTDDENDENEYEAWKLRELKRIKRDKEERENMEKEKQEIQKIRNMTEQEREKYFKHNPKLVINKPVEKAKYKFLQKYYHRGAFYMDKDEDIFKRNYAEPTLEDKFDKSILPKVMQVKNFGMAGRTKYTHLADQDTTMKGENPWENQHDYIVGKGGGTKQVFDKPTTKKRK